MGFGSASDCLSLEVLTAGNDLQVLIWHLFKLRGVEVRWRHHHRGLRRVCRPEELLVVPQLVARSVSWIRAEVIVWRAEPCPDSRCCSRKEVSVVVVSRAESLVLVINLHTSLVRKVDARTILTFYLTNVSLLPDRGTIAETLDIFDKVVCFNAAKIVLAVKHSRRARHHHCLVQLSGTPLVRMLRSLSIRNASRGLSHNKIDDTASVDDARNLFLSLLEKLATNFFF